MDSEPQAGDRWQRPGVPDVVVTRVSDDRVIFQQDDRQFDVTVEHYKALAAGCVKKGDKLVRTTREETEDFLFE